MRKPPSKAFLLLFGLIAVAAMIMLNTMSRRLDPKVQEAEAQAAAEKQAAAQKPITSATSTPGASGSAASTQADLATLGSDVVLGSNKPADREVTVRWAWTSAVQKDPSRLYQSINALATALPNVRLHVINTDEAPGTPTGVFVAGHQVTPASPDGNIIVDPGLVRTVLGATSPK